MVGRTPELWGKKIRAPEMKLVALYVLTVPLLVLTGAAVTVLSDSAVRSALNSGAHGLTEMLYAFASAANGNGSAFAGLQANTDWYNTLLGLAMLAGRFLPIVAVLALAGSLARGRPMATTHAPFPAQGPIFGLLLTGVIVVLGGLTYLPVLMLGPVAEGLFL